MAKVKKKLTAAQKRARKTAKAERQKKYMWVFMSGKEVIIKRNRRSSKFMPAKIALDCL